MPTFNTEDIKSMNYNQLIAIIGETNRPAGGIQTVLDFINILNIKEKTRVLEVGTATGFTAITLAELTGCHVTAVDINEDSIKIAKVRALKAGVNSLIDFKVENAMNFSFEDETFDVVFAGNIISYVPDREKVLSEYYRVLKNNGFLFVAPMFYREKPSQLLLDRVHDALKMDIRVDFENYWQRFFVLPGLDRVYYKKFHFKYISDEEIGHYVEDIFVSNKEYLDQFIEDEDTKAFFKKIYRNYIYLFRDNLFKMSYSEMFFRKSTFKFDRELFIAEESK